MRPLRSSRGFSLVELLIVVAIIGLLASILVPNLLDALQKASQKRTMVDIKGTGIAWMSWLTDQAGAASAGQGKFYNRNGFIDVTYPELFKYLHPSNDFFYAQVVPQMDAWKYDMHFARGGLKNDKILICAPCRGGTFETCKSNLVPVEGFLGTDYDQDLVWADGYFVRWPRGSTTN